MKEDKMIRDEVVYKEVRRLEKSIENMEHITKMAVMREIAKMKMNLEQPIEFEIPEFLEVK